MILKLESGVNMKKILLMFLLFSVSITNVGANSVNASLWKNNEEFSEESLDLLAYETGVDSPYKGQSLTYIVDKNNNIVRMEIPDGDSLTAEPRSVSTIAVFLGGAIVGYLTSTVIDGIVIAVTGESGAFWVAQAIENVLNKPYTGSTTITCDYYPPYSQEYYFCIYR
ncbi:hypothetical protein [Holdemania massiliensis]|uniref:hypothetical protein n=1 Tax=Holdemania massiliensis TaxID=1468449 RepID=UPI0005944806|nr:hypothetical protein [Holdemania massiliensis]